jgi:hypothetical protein
MTSDQHHIEITSTDYWFKVVGFLQTNWALLDEAADGTVTAWFLDHTGGVFDQLRFTSLERAVDGLMCNGFDFFRVALHAQRFLTPPQPPFRLSQHHAGAIYSSGHYWRKQ